MVTEKFKLDTNFGVHLQGSFRILEYPSLSDYKNQQNSRVLVHKRNAVHKDNASILMARLLTDRQFSNVAYMFFGDGGAHLDSTGTVILNSPHDTGTSADLYNPTYFQLVDDRRGSEPGNMMGMRHIAESYFSDADIRCLIKNTSPFGQLLNDEVDSVNFNTQEFVFNEIGLKTQDLMLITHVTFAPVLKTATHILEVVYTLRVAVEPVSNFIYISPPAPTPHVNLLGVAATSQVGTLTPHLISAPPSAVFFNGPPLPQFNSEALAVSADGSIVVGSSYISGPTAPGVGPHAYRWTQATGMQDLGTLPGDTMSGACLISTDGSTIAGLSLGNGPIHGFVWTQGTGMVNLGSLGGNTLPTAISSDGSVIIGTSGTGSGNVFRWTQGTGIVNTSTLSAQPSGGRQYMALSADGNTVVESYIHRSGTGTGFYAAVWTQVGGEVNIDTHSVLDFETTIAQVSADGSVAFGSTVRIAGSPGPAGTGTGNLQKWSGLPNAPVQTNLGTLDPSGIPISGGASEADGYAMAPFGISDDGSVVAGEMASPSPGGDFVRVFFWSQATGIIDIGDLGGTSLDVLHTVITQVNQWISFVPTYALSSCVSADGSTVVGGSVDTNNHLQAFRWTLLGGMVALPNIGGNFNVANAVSTNGSVIVGVSKLPNNINVHAFRWSQATGTVDLGTL